VFNFALVVIDVVLVGLLVGALVTSVRGRREERSWQHGPFASHPDTSRPAIAVIPARSAADRWPDDQARR
jgi:hypothetical protein